MKNHTIDFCVGWGPWEHDPFLEFIKACCKLHKISYAVCDVETANRTIKGLESGRTKILFYLDCAAEYEDHTDLFNRLAYAARDDGAICVNEPDRAKLSTNKAILHYHFERAGIPVPYTIVVRNWVPSVFKLTPQERRKLGKPFIIKPARGYGRQGVARVKRGTIREIAKARRYDQGDDFLLQSLIVPEWLDHRLGWFRVFYLFGEVILCWWDMNTGHYSLVNSEEFNQYQLYPLCEIMWSIANITQMNFYSTEMAITGKGAKRSILAIDYVNDPPDMTLQSFSHSGVPDLLVRHIAEGIVEAAWRVKHGLEATEKLSIWLNQ